MNTPSPFSFVADIGTRLAQNLQPPPWLIQEAQQRIVLLLNHVLMQEPEAMARLKRQKNRVVLAEWRQFKLALLITPAGLFNVAPDGAPADLRLHMTQTSPFELAKTAVKGEKPAVRIEGDVQLAAEINWLADHVRWDIEEDLSRVIGDVPAHTLVQTVRKMSQGLRDFVQSAINLRSSASHPSADVPRHTTSDASAHKGAA